MLTVLPESVRYMVAKGYSVDRIRAALRRISPTAATRTFVLTEPRPAGTAKSGLGTIFSASYAVGR